MSTDHSRIENVIFVQIHFPILILLNNHVLHIIFIAENVNFNQYFWYFDSHLKLIAVCLRFLLYLTKNVPFGVPRNVLSALVRSISPIYHLKPAISVLTYSWGRPFSLFPLTVDVEEVRDVLDNWGSELLALLKTDRQKDRDTKTKKVGACFLTYVATINTIARAIKNRKQRGKSSELGRCEADIVSCR